MPTNYTGNPTATEAPSPQPGPGVAPVLALPNDGEALNVASIYQNQKTLADFIALVTLRGAVACGDGSDGAVTLDGTATVPWASKVGSVYTMTRDCYCTTLLVTGAGVILKPNGWVPFARISITTAASGSISWDGNSAAGQTAGAATGTGTLLGGVAGGAGGNVGGAGANGSNQTSSLGGAGGAGGAGTGGAAGTGGTVTAPATALGSVSRNAHPSMIGRIVGISAGAAAITALTSGAGGGGGGGAAATNVGGGGGSGAGVGALCAPLITVANNFDLHAKGGDGGNAGANAGGGGSGGGGLLLLLCVGGVQLAAGGAATITAAANCGSGNAGGGGQAPGIAGAIGQVFQLPLF